MGDELGRDDAVAKDARELERLLGVTEAARLQVGRVPVGEVPVQGKARARVSGTPAWTLALTLTLTLTLTITLTLTCVAYGLRSSR